ncbi:MAG: hypothetical protein QM296_05045 [Bacillota bacterium]|nr:hypothetical protein [Bacillota bacterium]
MSRTEETLLMYGAGCIGRGFIGAAFRAAGYRVVFVDKDRELIRLLQARRSYPLEIMGAVRTKRVVADFEALDVREEAAVTRAIAECDWLATSVGAGNLPDIAPLLAAGLMERADSSGRPLDILICENIQDGEARLRQLLRAELPAARADAILDQTGCVATVIGCTVPKPSAAMQATDPLGLRIDSYDLLPVAGGSFRQEAPRLPQLYPVADLGFYEARKYEIHNMGHATLAYLAQWLGINDLAAAMEDPHIRLLVEGAMLESAAALAESFGRPFAGLLPYVRDLLARFANHDLGDTAERVGRDVLRKIRAGERFVAAIRRIRDAGQPAVYVETGLALALHSLGCRSAEAGTRRILTEHSELEAGPVLRLLDLVERLEEARSSRALFLAVERHWRLVSGAAALEGGGR